MAEYRISIRVGVAPQTTTIARAGSQWDSSGLISLMIVGRITSGCHRSQPFAQILGLKSTPGLEGAAAFNFSSSAGQDVNPTLVHGD